MTCCSEEIINTERAVLCLHSTLTLAEAKRIKKNYYHSNN